VNFLSKLQNNLTFLELITFEALNFTLFAYLI